MATQNALQAQDAASRLMATTDVAWLLLAPSSACPVAASESLAQLLRTSAATLTATPIDAVLDPTSAKRLMALVRDVADNPAPTCIHQEPMLFGSPGVGREQHSDLMVMPGPQAGQVLAVVQRRFPGNHSHLPAEAGVMLALGEFSAGLAHDLGNMLTVVLGNAELIQVACSDPEQPVDRAACQVSAERIMAIAQDAADTVRAVVRSAAGNTGHTGNVNEVVTALRPMLSHFMPPGVAVATDLQATGDQVEAPHAELMNALLNLCANARDAMAGHGELVLSSRDRATVDGRQGVQLRVTDSGCGIHPEVQDQVFRPFFTTKADGKGTGLGLANILRSVRRMGGSMRIRSWTADAPGSQPQGTQVDIWLPLASGSQSRPAQRAAHAVKPQRAPAPVAT